MATLHKLTELNLSGREMKLVESLGFKISPTAKVKQLYSKLKSEYRSRSTSKSRKVDADSVMRKLTGDKRGNSRSIGVPKSGELKAARANGGSKRRANGKADKEESGTERRGRRGKKRVKLARRASSRRSQKKAA